MCGHVLARHSPQGGWSLRVKAELLLDAQGQSSGFGLAPEDLTQVGVGRGVSSAV